ncbi:MAG: hypothetical protein R2822_24060 [Spirosomataceae bacterium]
MNSRTKALILTPFSLAMISYGLCVFSEAGHLKYTNAPVQQWVLMGLYSLIIINAGICFLGKALIFQVQYQYRRETRRKLRRMEKEWTAALKKKNAAQGGKNV